LNERIRKLREQSINAVPYISPERAKSELSLEESANFNISIQKSQFLAGILAQPVCWCVSPALLYLLCDRIRVS